MFILHAELRAEVPELYWKDSIHLSEKGLGQFFGGFMARVFFGLGHLCGGIGLIIDLTSVVVSMLGNAYW